MQELKDVLWSKLDKIYFIKNINRCTNNKVFAKDVLLFIFKLNLSKESLNSLINKIEEL